MIHVVWGGYLSTLFGLLELCEATVPSMNNVIRHGGGKKTIVATTQQSVPNPNHRQRPWCSGHSPLTTATDRWCVVWFCWIVHCTTARG